MLLEVVWEKLPTVELWGPRILPKDDTQTIGQDTWKAWAAFINIIYLTFFIIVRGRLTDFGVKGHPTDA